MVIRPSRFGGVMGGLFLFLGAIIFAIVASRGQIRSALDAILAVVVFGGIALYGLNGLLGSVVARIVVNDDTFEIRNRFGAHKRIPRPLIQSAARRSIFAPAQSGIYQNELLLIGEHGRCLARLWEADYDGAALRRMVESLQLKWPQARHASVRRVRQEFPGADAIDYPLVTVGILAVVALILAVITFAIMTH